MQIALVVGEQEGLDLYTRRFGSPNITFHAFRSLDEFKRFQKGGILYSGLLLDMRTYLRATPDEKAFLTDVLEERMPVGKFSRPSTGLDAVAEKILVTQWESFLKECENFNPRGVRMFPRKTCILKAQVCPDPAWDPQRVFRSVTADLSSGGCFVIAPESWAAYPMVSLLLGDSQEPIQARLAWERAWGSSLWQLPGFGIEFKVLSAVQKAAILRVLETVTKGGD